MQYLYNKNIIVMLYMINIFQNKIQEFLNFVNTRVVGPKLHHLQILHNKLAYGFTFGD